MNYRHSYHAGNFADVFKHLLLTRALVYLNKKPKPYMVMDTHGGIGRYNLSGEEAQKTQEFEQGILRLLEAQDLPGFTDDFVACVKQLNADSAPSDITQYPGSPWLSQALMRAGDRLIVCELHRDDATTLKTNLAPLKTQAKLEVLAPQDGYQALSAKLPPREKRGLVLIDPPFEQTDEYDQVVTALNAALKRWQSGSYAVWFPIKDPVKTAAFYDNVAALEHVPKTLLIELMIRTPDEASGLSGCGFVWLNPPFGVVNELDQILPFLQNLLGQSAGASASCRWLVEES